MKLYYIIACLTLIGISPFTSAQTFDDHLDYNGTHYHHHKQKLNAQIGDLTYSVNYKGMRSYMENLAVDDPELHMRLNPKFRRLEDRRNGAVIVSVAGFLAGSGLIIAGTNSLLSETNSTDFHEEFEESKRNMTKTAKLTFSGFGIYAIAGIVALIVNPDSDDYMDFINTNNRFTKGEKIKVTTQLISLPHNAIGLQLAINF